MKRIIAILCVIPLLFVAAEASAFSDVAEGAWYHGSVRYAAENGIVSGRGGGIFDPGGTLSAAEAVKLAAGVHAAISSSELPEQSGSPWYDTCFDYALSWGIIEKPPEDPDGPVTRARFAEYIYNAAGDLAVKNDIDKIRDIRPGSDYEEAVYSLYRAGVLIGADGYGRFYPERALTRAEACEIIMRALVPSARKYVNFSGELGPEEIFELCSGAVFSIETFDAKGETIRTGSGFFITGDGLAASNLHVLENAHSAKVTTTGGSVYNVLGAVACSADANVVIMRIDGDGFEWLPVASSDGAKTGQVVYSIGNPLKLDGTISRGIISFVGRENAGRIFLQFTASISQGSGGGALVDSRGYVIGITSSSYTAGSALNLATPSAHLAELLPGELIDLADIVHGDSY
ncbi:MAG: hypothetical protein GX823_07270 [Clostridiales bacterium]|nr:hypothetical protein [Clostridiales bacterium]